MEFHILPIFAFVSVVLIGVSHATLPSEVYWKKMLPYTAMPKAVTDALHPEWLEEKTSVSVGFGGVGVHTGKGGTTVSVGHGSVGVHTGKGTIVGVGHGSVGVHTGKGTSVSVGHKGGVGVSTGGGKTGVHVGKGGVSVGTRTKSGKPVHVVVQPGPNPFNYIYAASETQLKTDPATALFFLQKDLTVGTQMTLQFTTHPKNDAVFLPRRVADAIPFSSDKLPAILSRFSIDPNSDKAAIMKETVKECETKAIKGEDKYCATSLESMVDYAASKLGKNVEAVSTYAGKEEKKDKYTITRVKRIDVGEQAVACHKERYAYAVFYCHTTESTEAYELELAGEGGGKVKAAAVCHLDTTAWNPKHLAFQVLGVKPGSIPVCHFLPEDHIVWVRSG
ncbi:BURP domain protein RD22-like protein [Drosera capensis]